MQQDQTTGAVPTLAANSSNAKNASVDGEAAVAQNAAKRRDDTQPSDDKSGSTKAATAKRAPKPRAKKATATKRTTPKTRLAKRPSAGDESAKTRRASRPSSARPTSSRRVPAQKPPAKDDGSESRKASKQGGAAKSDGRRRVQARPASKRADAGKKKGTPAREGSGGRRRVVKRVVRRPAGRPKPAPGVEEANVKANPAVNEELVAGTRPATSVESVAGVEAVSLGSATTEAKAAKTTEAPLAGAPVRPTDDLQQATVESPEQPVDEKSASIMALPHIVDPSSVPLVTMDESDQGAGAGDGASAATADASALDGAKTSEPMEEASAAKDDAGQMADVAPKGPKHLAVSAAQSVIAKNLGIAKKKLHDILVRIPAHEALGKLVHYVREFIARLKVLPRAVWIAIASVLAVYVVGCLWFGSHFLPNTTVNGIDVSLMSQSAFSNLADELGSDYHLKVTGDGVNLSLAADDISLKYNRDQYVKSAFDQNPGWSWPVGMFLSHDISAQEGVEFNKKELASHVNAAVNEANATAVQPQNASLDYDDAKGTFVATASVDGTAVDYKAAVDKVNKGVLALRPEVKLGESELVQPSVQLDDTRINAAIVQANNRADLSIDLMLEDKVVSKVDSSMVREWMTLDDDCEVTGDAIAIEAYTRGDLSSQLDTVGTLRSYTRPDDGKTCQVYGGTYGWSIDGTELASMIVDRIADASSDPIKIPTLSEGYTWVQGGQDWGPAYIDVDLGEQIVRMYDSTGALVLLTYCVTGDSATNNGTVTGVYSIQEMASPKKLVGLDSNLDGVPDYENDVNYWMSFFGGYGLHDALWRDLFGGTVYQSSGSHGCVNLPYSQAQLMYNSVTIGYPVVVHM